MILILIIILLSIHTSLSYHYHLRQYEKYYNSFRLYNKNEKNEKNEKSNAIKYPSIASRRDLFYSNDNYLPTSDITNALYENDINDELNNIKIPKGLEKLEPTELIINDDDDNDIIQVDKFRFKVNANDLKRAIEMRSSLDTKQISSTNNDINDVNLKLSPEMVDLLSKIDIEEVDGVKKVSLRIDSNELDRLVNNDAEINNNDYIDDDDYDDDNNDIDDDDSIDEVIYKYNNNVMKPIKPATFYGDESQLVSFMDRKRNPISSTKETLPKVNWWLGGVGKYELSSDMIGTAVIMLGLSIVLTTFDTVAKSLQQFSLSTIMKTIQFLKIEKFIQKKFVPICLIGYGFSTLFKKYIKMRNDHKYDGIGYRVNL